MAARSAHAGSAPPTAKERIPDTDLTVEQLEEWRKWQKREEKVQGVIRTTVSDGIVIDNLDMNTDKQMWDYILATHQLDSPEEQAQVRDALATLRPKKNLRQRRWRYILNDPTLFYCAQGPQAPRSMRRKGLNDSLATPPKALAVLRLQSRLADPIRKTWLEVTKQYNLEAADRKRPSGTGNGTGFALLSKTHKQGQNLKQDECGR
jgi:hypothetical protein